MVDSGRIVARCRGGVCAVALLLLAVPWERGPRAQSYSAFAQDEQSYLQPAVPPAPGPAAQSSFFFREVLDIPLPGPLPDLGPRMVGDRIEIPLADGVARTDWTSEARPEIRPRSEPAPADGGREAPLWAETPSGKFRYGTQPTGRLVAQKRCGSCRSGWRNLWKLRVSGETPAPPLVTKRRVFFGSLDNRVYCVKRRNGHRVWATDVEGRVAKRLARLFFAGEAGAPGSEVVLVVPGKGSRIVALSARTGDKLAAFELPETGGRLVGPPLPTPDGKIVVARQKYRDDEASLLVLQLVPTASSKASTENSREPLGQAASE